MSVADLEAERVDCDLLSAAVELAQRAGEVTMRWFTSDDLSSETKPDGSPVTDADRAGEDFLRCELQKRYPEDGILGEEHGFTEGSSGRQWLIDPVDGTRSFIAGVPLYSTLLALIDEKGPAIGVVALPALDEAVWAGRGLGAQHRKGAEIRPARVSSTSELGDARLTTSGLEYLSQDLGAWLASRHSGLARTWGDGYGYALLATGRVDAMIDPGLSVWDAAPMLVIVPEAGGRITKRDGSREPTDGDYLATNGIIHKELLATLKGLW